jgi:hypothetical protein
MHAKLKPLESGVTPLFNSLRFGLTQMVFVSPAIRKHNSHQHGQQAETFG